MKVRKATYHDAPFIKLLLEEQGYQSSISLLVTQLDHLFDGRHHHALVCESRGEVIGFAVVHVLPQLAFDGGLLIISDLSVDERTRDQSVARALEMHIAEMARSMNCGRIQVHCAEWRVQAQRFYLQQGYTACPQYYTKRLVYGE